MSAGKSTLLRAIAYVRAMPGAVEHQGGHKATFEAACALTHGFELDDATALRILEEIHNPRCEPPWTRRELEHKVQSARTRCRRPLGYLLEPTDARPVRAPARPRTPPSSVDRVTYHRVASRLLELCELDREPDVLRYLKGRQLLDSARRARLAGLPAPREQGRLIAELLKNFDAKVLLRVGFLRANRGGEIQTARFCFPEHRLIIPWCGQDGVIEALQRRALTSEAEHRYVFPRGLRAKHPFGSETIAGASSEAVFVFCEGALDALSIRELAARDGLDVVALGIPGLESWRPEWAQLVAGRDVLVGLDNEPRADEKATRIGWNIAVYAKGLSQVDLIGVHDWNDLLTQADECSSKRLKREIEALREK